MTIYKESVCIIQAYFKMKLTRKQYLNIVSFEKLYSSVVWPRKEKNVFVVGNFTYPPWTVQLRMEYCNLRKINVKYLTNLSPGTYLYYFIVDGIRLHCKEKAKETNENGQVYNVLQVRKRIKCNPVYLELEAFELNERNSESKNQSVDMKKETMVECKTQENKKHSKTMKNELNKHKDRIIQVENKAEEPNAYKQLSNEFKSFPISKKEDSSQDIIKEKEGKAEIDFTLAFDFAQNDYYL